MTNMPLSVEAYNRAEQEARTGLSFTEIAAFSPCTFEALGFPHRVVDERELVRYADWNRDAENQHYFRPGGFSPGPAVRTDYTLDEVAMMNCVRDLAVEVTRNLGCAIRPLCSPFSAIGLFRITEALRAASGLSTLRVFEVGPGSGYLGAMLINKRLYAYSSMDNAQAFSLWQRRLFQGPTNSIFWWDFLKLRFVTPFDVVISNSNLAEMHVDALRVVAHHAKLMLDGSPLGLFLFTNFGSQMQNTNDGVHVALERAGFRRVFDRLFQGYITDRHQLPFDTGPLQADIPLYNPSDRPELLAGADTVRIPEDQRPLDLDIVELLGEWELPKVT